MSAHKAFPDKFNWSLLHTFLVIVQEGSLSRAAIQLHLTQSAVSQSLKKLEDQVGYKLLERSRQNFLLTPQGKSFFQAAHTIYGEIANLESQLPTQNKMVSGSIKLLVVSRIQSKQYDEFLTNFRQHYPQVDFHIEVLKSAEILRHLSQKMPVLGLGLCRTEPEKIHKEILIKQRYGLYCGKNHPLFNQENISMEQLRTQSFVSFQSDQLGDALSPLTVFRDNYGFSGQIVATTNSLDEVVRLLRVGFGIGCLPEHIANSSYLKNTLRKLPPEEGVADIPIYLMWHKERILSLAERYFINELRQSFAETA